MYNNEQLLELVKTVENEFSAHLNRLAKSEEESEKKDEDKEEAKPEHKEKEEKDEPKSESKEEKSPEHKEEGEEHKEESSEHKEESKEEGEEPKSAPSEEDHGYDEEDMKHMGDMYGSMSKAELRAHHDSIRKCMDGMGLAKCEDGMHKSEKDTAITISSDEIELLKSELAAEKAKGEESKKNLATVVESLTKFVTKSAPVGKSITSTDIIAKSEGVKKAITLTSTEITSVLAKKASNPAMSAEDKQAINDYLFGSKNIEKVRHLL